MSEDCIVRNIDKFCQTFVSISMNSGSFNNTKVDIEILGEVDPQLNYGPLLSLKEQFKNVLPFFSEENWKVVNASCSKSESGVISKYSLQDLYSLDANNHMVGLYNRVGGDSVLGQEYYSVSGVPDPSSNSVPIDLLISRSKLMSWHNFLKNGKYFINSSGNLSLNTEHYLNKSKTDLNSLSAKGGMVGSYPNPYFDFGVMLYRFSDLFKISKHPIGGEPDWSLNIDGLFNDTGSFFSVINSIISPYGKVFVANPFLGGYYVHSPSSDFGKLSVLNNAGIKAPESSISSSITRDYYSGYSTGAFLRTFREGYAETPPEEDDIAGSSAITYDNYELHSDQQQSNLLDLNKAMQNIAPPDGWGSWTQSNGLTDPLADQMAASRILNTELCLDYHIYATVSDSLAEVGEEEKILILNRRSDRLNFGTNPNNYFVFKDSTILGLIQSARETYSELPQSTDNNLFFRDIVPAGSIGLDHPRIHPEMIDYYIRKKNTFRYIEKFQNKKITRNGHPTSSAILGTDTIGFENFGTANDVRGRRSWFSDSGHEVQFLPHSLPLNGSPFSWFSSWSTSAKNGTDMDVKDFYNNFLNKVFTESFANNIEGSILVDKGESDISHVEKTIDSILSTEVEKSTVLIDVDAIEDVSAENTKQGVLIVPAVGNQTRIGWLFSEISASIKTAIKDAEFDDGQWNGSNTEYVWFYGQVKNGSSIYNSYNSIQGNNPISGYLANRHSIGNIVSAERANVDRFESFIGNPGQPHPNRSIRTYEKEFSNYAGANGQKIIYVTTAGKVGQAAYFNDLKNMVDVESLSKISFTLMNELIDFEVGEAKDKNWKKYLESFDVSISGGNLTATYVFSQKILMPDYLSIENSKASLQSLIKG